MTRTIKTASWDAALNTKVCDKNNNAELTITVRLGFRQVNPTNGATTGFYNDFGAAVPPPGFQPKKIVKWSPQDWLVWKKDFVRTAKKYWHGKFWLINNHQEIEFTDGNIKYTPNIYCRFNLVESDFTAAGNYHHVIDVVNLDRTETWFGSHSTLYDSLDLNPIKKSSDSNGNPIMQRAHVHEVGHLLGLGHLDEGKSHCPSSGNTNAAICYGVTDIDKNSVMGGGMQLRAKHANPWRRAIITMTGKGAVLNSSDWAPKMVRTYPKAHAAITTNR
jgi:hypothetical protein